MLGNVTVGFPDWFSSLVEKADQKYPKDIDKGLDWLYDSVTAHKDYPDLIDHMVKTCLRDLLHDTRHKRNCRIKKQTKAYNNTPNINYGEASQSIYTIILSYRIGCKTLGDVVLGEESLNLAKTEEEIAQGHLFNAAVLRWATSAGRIGETIKDSIPFRVLVRNWKRLQDEYKTPVVEEEEVLAGN